MYPAAGHYSVQHTAKALCGQDGDASTLDSGVEVAPFTTALVMNVARKTHHREFRHTLKLGKLLPWDVWQAPNHIRLTRIHIVIVQIRQRKREELVLVLPCDLTLCKRVSF